LPKPEFWRIPHVPHRDFQVDADKIDGIWHSWQAV
jgi:hypothetical protein